jgi:hypothetical protein
MLPRFDATDDSVVTLHITKGLMSNKTQTTVAPTDAARRLDSRAEFHQDLPTMPDPSRGNPEGGKHLPVTPDLADQPSRGQQLPSEPDPSRKPVRIGDPPIVNEGEVASPDV